jgi:DNA-directed RNA polymerase specialized sigma54-like protein
MRHEIEALVIKKFGEEYLNKKNAQKELAQVKKELKEIKARMESLEQRKNGLLQILDQ